MPNIIFPNLFILADFPLWFYSVLLLILLCNSQILTMFAVPAFTSMISHFLSTLSISLLLSPSPSPVSYQPEVTFLTSLKSASSSSLMVFSSSMVVLSLFPYFSLSLEQPSSSFPVPKPWPFGLHPQHCSSSYLFSQPLVLILPKISTRAFLWSEHTGISKDFTEDTRFLMWFKSGL